MAFCQAFAPMNPIETLKTFAHNPPGFASFTYTAKGSGETARHTVILGFDYNKSVEKSLTDLACINRADFPAISDELWPVAVSEIRASLEKTLAAHVRGEQNADYTKKDQYLSLGFSGMHVNLNDGSLQVFGLAHAKTVLVPGEYKPVKSRPLTLAKEAIRKTLAVGKFREFAFDSGTIHTVRMNGSTLEIE